MAALLISAFVLTGCGDTSLQKTPKDDRLLIVATIFPAYDFARSVGGERAEVYQLLKSGAESHTYEPTPADMVMISKCDVFIYAGGASDSWIESIIESIDMSGKVVISMLDCVETLEEEEKEGMNEGGVLAELLGEEEEELDEHVWTSPKNAIDISRAIANGLTEADPAGEEVYLSNFYQYESELNKLDASYRNLMAGAKRNTIVVADRFPFRYLCQEYGIDYYAVFPGCSDDAEITAKSLVYICDRVREENIPVVFHIEFSNEKIADSVCEVTNAKKLLLHSCHNVSNKEIEGGATYISLMYNNLEALSEALN